MTTDEIDNFVHEECITHNCYPSPLMYKGFPKSVCTSVNNVVVHGIPDNRPLEDGDIVNVDITVCLYFETSLNTIMFKFVSKRVCLDKLCLTLHAFNFNQTF